MASQLRTGMQVAPGYSPLLVKLVGLGKSERVGRILFAWEKEQAAVSMGHGMQLPSISGCLGGLASQRYSLGRRWSKVPLPTPF